VRQTVTLAVTPSGTLAPARSASAMTEAMRPVVRRASSASRRLGSDLSKGCLLGPAPGVFQHPPGHCCVETNLTVIVVTVVWPRRGQPRVDHLKGVL
jgi:hypothetical protein